MLAKIGHCPLVSCPNHPFRASLYSSNQLPTKLVYRLVCASRKYCLLSRELHLVEAKVGKQFIRIRHIRLSFQQRPHDITIQFRCSAGGHLLFGYSPSRRFGDVTDRFVLQNMGTSSFAGPGAGRYPTANSVVNDLVRLGTGKVGKPFPFDKVCINDECLAWGGGNAHRFILITTPSLCHTTKEDACDKRETYVELAVRATR